MDDLYDLYHSWEHSENKWDDYIKSLTPDLLDYICDLFRAVYQSGRTLSNMFNALEKITASEERNTCLYEIKQAMLNYYFSDTIVNDAVKLIPVNDSTS